MTTDNDNVVIGRRAAFAWLGLAAIITIAAAIGIVCGHGGTAITILAVNGICSGLFAAFATLRGKTRTSNILALTAALSAVAGLLVKEAETFRQMFVKPDTQSLIVAAALFLTILLAWGLFSYNRENHEPRGRPEQTSPRTTNSNGEPHA